MKQKQPPWPRWYLVARCFVTGAMVGSFAVLWNGPDHLRRSVMFGCLIVLASLEWPLKRQRDRIRQRQANGTRAAV